MSAHDSDQARILIAIDDAFSARNALPVGRALARQLGTGLAALYVAPSPISIHDARRRLQFDTDAEQDLSLAVRVGEPAREILAAAHEPGVRLLVIVARGLQASTVIGSVTLSVLNGSQVPVVLVRPSVALMEVTEIPPVRRLLLPVDGSPTTARALRVVTGLAQQLRAHLDLLYVAGSDAAEVEPGTVLAPRYVDQPQHEWPSWSAEVMDLLCRCLARCPEDVPADVYLAAGDPGEEVPRFAAEHDEDAIVLVRRSQIGAGRARTLLSIFERSNVPLSIVVTPFDREAPAPFNTPSAAASR